ncbi:MAG: hypothetical protein CMG00_06325 [Candidatus Marinimicrobia bacterium]|nr:hypothetical protein [Candidatus Neomarinimicrobiota bacterium]|tara:strand:+ start:3342 stop:4472 length:1131 start_codon:yes stop_codon:yes gene_type:complete
MSEIKISFICCLWNEINRAPKEYEHLLEKINQLDLQKKVEILLIDNNSDDGTREWIQSLDNPITKKVLNKKNIGKGGSIKKGILNSHGDIGVIFDLDGEYDVDDAFEGINCLKNKKASMVLSSRTLDGRADYVYIQNYLGVRFLTEITNFLYNERLSDTATGLKIINLNFYKKEKILFNGFNVDFELVCIALNKGKKVTEFNGKYFPRSKKEGKKIKAFKDGFQSIFAILYCFFKNNSFIKFLSNGVKYLFTKSAFRYFLIGGLATIFDICIFYFLFEKLNMAIFSSNLIAFCVALFVNYFLGITTVFKKNCRFSNSVEIFLVTLFSLIGVLLNTLTVSLVIQIINISLIGKLIAVFPTFFWNYISRRYYIYKKVK